MSDDVSPAVDDIDKRLADLLAPDESKPTALQQRRDLEKSKPSTLAMRSKAINEADAMRRKAITDLAKAAKAPDGMAEHLRSHRYTVAEAKLACDQWRTQHHWLAPRGGMGWSEVAAK